MNEINDNNFSSQGRIDTSPNQQGPGLDHNQQLDASSQNPISSIGEEATKAVWSFIAPKIYGNTITIFGLFATLFTYIGVQVQIIASICHFSRLLGTSLILFGGMFGFLCGLFYFIVIDIGIKDRVIDGRMQPNKMFYSMIIRIILIGIGVTLLATTRQSELECKATRESSMRIIQDKLINLENDVKILQFKIQNLEDENEDLEKTILKIPFNDQ